MTPFGERLRTLREERGILLKDMAADLGVSATYLSALEHGRRSKPNWSFVQRVIHWPANERGLDALAPRCQSIITFENWKK